ncbi:DoxX family protein [Nocardioides sp.]|uniref:DoxX family protein n=1 Tax=Nocardioides sp. TaxID=35761 RepID=UPI002B26B28A|nr:DoxX family protein [Nocardioides sp.]
MDIVIWILSGLLALVFVAAGAMKLATPRAKLLENPQMGWADDFSAPQIQAIGAIEVLGGIGVILPWLLDVLPVLTPLAALGLAATMVGAMIQHARRDEKEALPKNAVLLVLALAVAVIRFAQL